MKKKQQPTTICHHYVLLPPTAGPWLWRPQGQFGGVGGDERKARKGASLLLKRLEHSMASHQPPQGPPEAHTRLILVEMSSSMGREGNGAYWELMRDVGGSHRGRSITLRTRVDGVKMDSLSAASRV